MEDKLDACLDKIQVWIRELKVMDLEANSGAMDTVVDRQEVYNEE
jgi:hypothetical protein